MAHSLLWLAAALLPVAAALPVQASAQPALEIRFDHERVLIDGVAEEGRVLLHGLTRERVENSFMRLDTFEAELSDDDGDGSVEYDVGRELPWRSLWVAVELESGRVATASPNEPLRELSPGKARTPSDDRIAVDSIWFDLLVVRPSGGAWKRRIDEGGSGDDDGSPDGTARVRFDALPAASDATREAASQARTGDVIVIIDLRTLAHASYRYEGDA